ncbi:polyphosphate kinase 2 family protein [Microcella daejeonensis]|uniref:PPK2 family polyphosphate kinase n=1 Tax=Microcella daejeonensis TaxID=2994971 RepID=UPI00226D91C1|nr:PPK2 family polyphosphate kinase [Microcella daejeonensis]WAB84232.1 polyphosphate kinase 2 family protein [Microcella daejeonensis]
MTDLLRAGTDLDLSIVDPRSTPGFEGGKAEGAAALAAGADEISHLQERLYAASRAGRTPRVLLVLQAMDTAGKGGIVRHVVGAVDPQGVQLAAFKKPTPEELAEHFLARIERRLPAPGMIGVFDRSHYEDVLIARVRSLAEPAVIQRRYGEIRDFERRVADGGTRLVKVMLHISPEEQKARLAERLDRPDKHWKYNPGDVDERLLWPDYMAAYERAIAETDADHAPWYVVPADRKWFARLAVQQLLIEALRDIDPQWPTADFDVEAEKARLAAS